MSKRAKHVLGISGGKDSAALAIYLRDTYPKLDIEYYCCDTEKELSETYELISNLEKYLGKKIERLKAVPDSHVNPFDHFLQLFGGYLPSSQARWCTKRLKLEPFEKYVSDDPVVSYVGIRGDEDREGYISKKSNIQSIFPFRKNIWSEDVISKVLTNKNIHSVQEFYGQIVNPGKLTRANEIVLEPISDSFTRQEKHNALLELDTPAFNKVVFRFLKDTNYPLALEEDFPLLDNSDVLVKDDIFRILKDSGVGVPNYYEEIAFEIDGQRGKYARSRSGCYFCFFQQRIEWVWLYEQHPDMFMKAMEYEKTGYSWAQGERLEDLIKPDRIREIKLEYIKRQQKSAAKTSGYLVDTLDDTEEGCAACFI
jgi:3'-phosphoadenosine 5'-phosphosulfate sulfotransferase (PAPS reductase)/FAD synthetase